MIEGIVVGNGLSGARADRIRAALWLAIDSPIEPQSTAPALEADTAAGTEDHGEQLVAI